MLRCGIRRRLGWLGGTHGWYALHLCTLVRDLTEHRCIDMRMPAHDSLITGEFEKEGREVKVRVEGQLTYNSLAPSLRAALGGLGIANMPEPYAEAHVASGCLVHVLQDWRPLQPAVTFITPADDRACPHSGSWSRCYATAHSPLGVSRSLAKH
jgi:DNA-binding transcriptional LysR family regulator